MHVQNIQGCHFLRKKKTAGRSTTSPSAWFHYLPLTIPLFGAICRYLPLFAANFSTICRYLPLAIPLFAAKFNKLPLFAANVPIISSPKGLFKTTPPPCFATTVWTGVSDFLAVQEGKSSALALFS